MRHPVALVAVYALLGACSTEPEAPRPVEAADGPVPRAAVFVEAARDAGIDFIQVNGMTGNYLLPEPLGSGAAFFDMDRDGDLDLYLVQGGLLEPDKSRTDALFELPPGPLLDRLFRNDLDENGGLRFVEITEESLLRSDGYGMGVTAGDYDGDGWVDLYVTNVGSNRLWRNRGDGTFEDVTRAAGVDDPRWSSAAVFFDFDGDGRLDLYVGNYVDFNLGTHQVCGSDGGHPDYCGPQSFRPEPDRLFRNRGDGTFADVTSQAGLSGDFGPALGALAADFNGDHRLDLYVANDGSANQMWINLGGRFENRALLGGTALSGEGIAEAGMGVDAGDFDNDGDVDLFVSHLSGETNTLYRNNGRGTFVDASQVSRLGGPSLPMTGFGSGWLDYDNDGWLDLMVVNGAIKRQETLAMVGEIYPLGQPNQLFHNLGDGRFEEVSDLAGEEFRSAEVSRGAAFGDVDNDGDLDVLIVNNSGACRLLLNVVGQDRSWIGVRLALDEVWKDAVDGVLRVILPDGRVLERRSHRARGYLSSSDPRVLVGLADVSEIEDVRVVWPDGSEESFGPLPVRRYHLLRRGEGAVLP